jgi:hypothetical protein
MGITKTRKELFEILRQQNSGERLHSTSNNQNHVETKPRNTTTASEILEIREYRSKLHFCVKTTHHHKTPQLNAYQNYTQAKPTQDVIQRQSRWNQTEKHNDSSHETNLRKQHSRFHIPPKTM